MTHRVIDDEVRQLITIEDTDDSSPFIETANIIVNAKLLSSGLSFEMLRQIELYLAAHFTSLAFERGAPKRMRVGESVEEFYQDIGPGLRQTRFGQMALFLDSSGILGSTNAQVGKPPAQFRVY